jgi:hypothetical protein
MTCLNIFTKESGHRPVVCVSRIIGAFQTGSVTEQQMVVNFRNVGTSKLNMRHVFWIVYG